MNPDCAENCATRAAEAPDRRRCTPRAFAAALALCAAAAGAETTPFYIGVSEIFKYDDNVLRVADGAPTPEGFSKADSSFITSLLAGFDQPFGRQRGYATLNLRDTRFRHNTVYDYLGYDFNGGLDWSTAERISGQVIASASRNLYAFETGYSGTLLHQQNLQDTESLNANVSVGIYTQYSLTFGIGTLKVDNSLDEPAVQALNYRQDSASLALRWRPRSGSEFSATLTQVQGQYPQYLLTPFGYISDRFKQPSIAFGANIQPTGASTIDLRIGYTQTHYDLNEPRDFAGVIGHAVWIWDGGGRLKLTGRISRDTGQNAYAVTVAGFPGRSDYAQVYNTLLVQSEYAVAGKVSVIGSVQVVARDIVNNVRSPFGADEVEGSDRSTLLSLGFRWTPLRSTSLGCELSSERRTAVGVLTTPLHSNAVACTARFELQR